MTWMEEVICVVDELQPRHWEALQLANRLETFQSIILYEPASAKRYAMFCAGEHLP